MIQWIIFTDERAGRPRASKSRQRFLPYRFAAREGRSPDRQICQGGPAGGTPVPLSITVHPVNSECLRGMIRRRGGVFLSKLLNFRSNF